MIFKVACWSPQVFFPIKFISNLYTLRTLSCLLTVTSGWLWVIKRWKWQHKHNDILWDTRCALLASFSDFLIYFFIAWVAPEIISSRKYSFKADVYSFGICLWEMFTRETPHGDLSPYEIVLQVATKVTVPSFGSVPLMFGSDCGPLYPRKLRQNSSNWQNVVGIPNQTEDQTLQSLLISLRLWLISSHGHLFWWQTLPVTETANHSHELLKHVQRHDPNHQLILIWWWVLLQSQWVTGKRLLLESTHQEFSEWRMNFFPMFPQGTHTNKHEIAIWMTIRQILTKT